MNETNKYSSRRHDDGALHVRDKKEWLELKRNEKNWRKGQKEEKNASSLPFTARAVNLPVYASSLTLHRSSGGDGPLERWPSSPSHIKHVFLHFSASNSHLTSFLRPIFILSTPNSSKNTKGGQGDLREGLGSLIQRRGTVIWSSFLCFSSLLSLLSYPSLWIANFSNLLGLELVVLMLM